MKVVSIIAIIITGLLTVVGIEYGIVTEAGLLVILAGIWALGGYVAKKDKE